VKQPPVGPLLKWAGGKRQLLPQLRPYYPRDFGRYIEPFVGSGAVFFDLWSSGRLGGHDVVLMDSNADLIACYETVRDRPDRVIAELDRLATEHGQSGRRHYYEVRDGRFNPLRARMRASGGRLSYTPELAAMLIYLNRTGYNGLFRLNARGEFNVPAGDYARPTIADHRRIAGVAEALSRSRVELRCASFERARDIAKRGDFLYVDPPYSPLSRTANFTSYTAPKFDAGHQAELQRMVVTLARHGCHVLVSNSTSDEIAGLYERDATARRAGLRAIRVQARRAINSNGSRRGLIDEYLITNIRCYAPDNQTS
jgi:DNA adenine methylase